MTALRTIATALLAASLLPINALAREELAEVGRPAPSFRLPVYNVKPVGSSALGLDQYVGPSARDKEAKVVLLSFMASFCAPCKKEMPWLQALQERLRGEGLRVVMISIDKEPEGQKKIEGLIEENGITYPVLKDRFNLVARRWLGSQSPLPSVFLVGKDGAVIASHKGYSEEITQTLEAEVKAALGASQVAKQVP
jgi:cytochrome c biogenesis protein CcmG, thiol:disulfide interchange protein DsbE